MTVSFEITKAAHGGNGFNKTRVSTYTSGVLLLQPAADRRYETSARLWPDEQHETSPVSLITASQGSSTIWGSKHPMQREL